MAIGDWLNKAGEATGAGGHPLAEMQGIEQFLRGLSAAAPAAVLLQVREAIKDAASGGIGVRAFARALSLLDNRAQSAAAEMVRSLFRDLRGNPVTEASVAPLARYYHGAGAYYAKLFEDAASANSARELREQAALFACRSLYALGQWKKFARISYSAPEAEVWQALHAVHVRGAELGLAQQQFQMYPDRAAPTSPHAEYMVTMVLETVPLGSLSSGQIECFDLLLQRFAPGFTYSDKPFENACFLIELARGQPPQRWLPGLPIRAGARFIGPGELRSKIAGLSSEARRHETVPDWALRSGCDGHAYRDLLEYLADHWSAKPPQRRERRNPGTGEVLLVYGLTEARRVLGAGLLNEAVEAPQEIDQPFNELDPQKQFERLRSGLIGSDAAAKGAILRQNESREEKLLQKLDQSVDAGAERSAIADMSESGLGLALAANARLTRVGELVAFRLPKSTGWELAIVRRIARAGSRLLLGLERMRGQPTAARAEPAADPLAGPTLRAETIQGTDAILISGQPDRLVVASGGLAPGKAMRVKTASGNRSFRLGEVYGAGGECSVFVLQPL